MPLDKEVCKMDMMSRRICAAMELGLRISNHETTMACYQYFLWQTIKSFAAFLPDQQRELACIFIGEAMQLLKQQLSMVRHYVNCDSRALVGAVALCCHAWLRVGNLPLETEQRVENMLFNSSGLFHSKTNDKLEHIHKAHLTTRWMEYSSQPRRRSSLFPIDDGLLDDGHNEQVGVLNSPTCYSAHQNGERIERFSRKVFVGGLPPDIDEDEITASFRRFGPLVVDWPHKAESKSYFPPKGIRSDRVLEELWTEVCNIVLEVATKTITKKKQCKKAKWLSEEALQIAEERREAKGKGEKERYTQLNAEFQRTARRDKNAFLNEQCKEIEENNRAGKTRDLFKKIGDMKGTFHAKMGMIKDQNGRDLTEAEEIKKRWQDYKEELYKKELNIPDNHNGLVTDLEPDILECEVKRALGSLRNIKASGGDSIIPAELFKILKGDAVNLLHSICQQIWKTQQWPQDWKRSVHIQIPKNSNAKECSNYCTIALISHASKVMLKILQARLQQYVDRELPEVQAGFRRGRGTRDQIANTRWIKEKAREFQKNI
ncbi:Cytoplasmic polyadenylation element-binding protein 2 [Varanus komodoensis]|nr:Cytoplasmic polyadenylation element-binding protein 2 [Varanus komodoensis]